MRVHELQSEWRTGATVARQGHLALLSWVSMLGTDLLLHAGVLARLYADPGPFLLEPAQAFARIPIGYLSFLLLALLLTHLVLRLDIRSWRGGMLFGLALGASIWGALTLGLASISTATASLLAGWFVGQTIELGVAGAIVGAALQGVRTRRLWLLVAGWCVVAFAITVVMQNTGLAPALLTR